MNILRGSNNLVLAVLKPQLVSNNVNYRLMKFNLIIDIDGGKLIHNELTRSIVFMGNDEFNEILDKKNILKYEYLYRNYFLVPEDFNEIEVTDEVRKHFIKDIDELYLERVQSYEILTTTKCNARCFYCYELHSKGKAHMTEETAHKIVNYIRQHSSTSIPVNLSWFGGEPLFNMKVIDTITNGLRDLGFKFYSSFTSNGYLLDEKVITKAVNSWGMTFVQITIDGTESVYNKTKNYIYKNVNAYQRVLNNIALALNAGISVAIRLNCDNYNINDLLNLVSELHSRFGNHPKLSIYTYPIFEEGDYSRTDEEEVSLFSGLEKLENLISSLGYPIGEWPSDMIMFSQCMADGGNKITISPNGDLGTCEHFIDSDFWGHIDKPEMKDYDILKGWKVYEKPYEGCENCPRYPSCLRPSKCIEMRKCNIYYKNWYLRKQRLGLINWYRKQMNSIRNNNQNVIQNNVNNMVPKLKTEEPKKESKFKKFINKWM